MTDRRKFLTRSLVMLAAPTQLLAATCDAMPVAGKTGADKKIKAGENGTACRTEESLLSQRLKKINKNTVWNLVKEIKVSFKTFHCQGMVKIGSDFWVSSVEVDIPASGVFDRSKGAGHLFRIDASGKLLDDLAIGEGSIYHPSGIDFDGEHIWIAAAEYRPDSQAIIYKVDPSTRQIKEVFRWKDHIGGIARNTVTNTLHGISWGSRRFYQWQLDKEGQVRQPLAAPAGIAVLNPSFYIDYQDNQYLGGQEILYTGLAAYKKPGSSLASGGPAVTFALGGMEIVDLSRNQPIHQVPVQLWSPATGAVLTQNPTFFELAEGEKIRAYFMPDDNESTIFIYEA